MHTERRRQPRRATRPRSRRGKSALSLLAAGLATASMLTGSYAAWTAQTDNPLNSVAAGTLTMSNDKDATSVFAASNVKPGDSGSDTVTVENTGSLPMTVRLSEDTISATGIETSLRMSIHDDTTNRCYWPTQGAGACGSLGAWDGSATLTNHQVHGSNGLATQWDPAESHTFTISWELLSTSPNSDQGKTGSFRLVWDGAQ